MTDGAGRGGADRGATRLYVVAITDRRLPRQRHGGRLLETVPLARGIHAACERRDRAPEPSDAELRAQHALVIELAERADAILPVRFGTLLTNAELRRLVRMHVEEIAAALDEVCRRVQMTVRIVGRPAPVADDRAVSGREYMELKRAAAAIALPPEAQQLLEAARPFVVRERHETGAGGLLATVYHLVARDDVDSYQRAVSRLRGRVSLVSGPWPPFAFTPRWS